MKRILITGAGGQLGTVVTRHFLSKGFRVLALTHGGSVDTSKNAHEAMEERVVDLSSEEETSEQIRKAIEEGGAIDAALLLAGGFGMGGLEETSSADIQAQVRLNFNTAYHVVRPLFAHMMERGKGQLVLIASKPALQPSLGKNMLAYTLSKSMLVTLAEMLNARAGESGVRVSVVAPSTIDTEINRKSMPDADFSNWVKPETLAELFEFLCSDAASVLKGAILKAYNNA